MFTREDVERLSASLEEPAWVSDKRIEAWNYADKFELPQEKEEAWRYTDFRRLKFSIDAFTALSRQPGLALAGEQQSLLEEEGDRSGYLIRRDTEPVLTDLDPDLAAKGVVVADLATAVAQYEDIVRPHLFSQYPVDSHLFNALHAALFCGGTFIYVPKGVSVPLPVESQTWIDRSGVAHSGHVLIILEEDAEVTYFERFRSTGVDEPSLSLGGVEVVGGAGSRINYVSLQEFGENIWHFQTQVATLGASTTYRNLVVGLGAKFARTEVRTAMNGDGASVEMLGLYFAAKGQHFDFRTLQDHAAAHCNSDLLYKGALKDSSHAVYSGLIHVRPNGRETDAYQTNRNLVLSDDARADSKPELEIENNDVRCSHGASVGQINEQEIFYLGTRGISRPEAEKLIVNGFFEEVISRVNDQEIRGVLKDAIQRKLTQ